MTVGASGACWASVWLSRGFRWLVALAPVASRLCRILDCLSRACPLWHPTAFLTTRAFYGSDSGPLQGSDLAVSFVRSSILMSILSLYLTLPIPLSGNPAFPFQWAPSGLPEPMTQFEQQGSSLALTRLLAMTADDNAYFVIPHTLTRSFDNLQFKSRIS